MRRHFLLFLAGLFVSLPFWPAMQAAEAPPPTTPHHRPLAARILAPLAPLSPPQLPPPARPHTGADSPKADVAAASSAASCQGVAATHGAYLAAHVDLFSSEGSFSIFDTWMRLVAEGSMPQPRVVADVGANRGQSARLFLRAFPLARVASFEPSAHNFRQLLRAQGEVTAEERSRWALHALAVAAAVGVANFSAPSGEGHNPETFTLGQRSDLGLLHSETVNVTTVDALLQPGGVLGSAFLDLLKVDVEGWECDVLAGAEGALAASPPRVGAIFFEYSPAWLDGRRGPRAAPIRNVEARLRAQGFECFFAGQTDLVRVAHGLEADIVGMGPNVLCLHRDVPASRTLVAEHKSVLQQCLW